MSFLFLFNVKYVIELLAGRAVGPQQRGSNRITEQYRNSSFLIASCILLRLQARQVDQRFLKILWIPKFRNTHNLKKKSWLVYHQTLSVIKCMFSMKTYWHGTLLNSLVLSLTSCQSCCSWLCKNSWSKLFHKGHVGKIKGMIGKQNHDDCFWRLLPITWITFVIF